MAEVVECRLARAGTTKKKKKKEEEEKNSMGLRPF
jgi:hypothetical protein